jgi:flagellar motor switch protein FliN
MTAELDLLGVLDATVQAGSQKLGTLLGSQVTFGPAAEGVLPADLPPTHVVALLRGEPTLLVLVQGEASGADDSDLLPTLAGAVGQLIGAGEPETVEGPPSADPDDHIVVWDGTIGEVTVRLYWIIPSSCAAELSPLDSATPTGMPTTGGLGRLAEVMLEVTVELGRTTVPIGELLALDEGGVIKLGQPVTHPVDLLVNGLATARGEIVVVDGRLGVRITELVG